MAEWIETIGGIEWQSRADDDGYLITVNSVMWQVEVWLGGSLLWAVGFRGRRPTQKHIAFCQGWAEGYEFARSKT